jgi:hypothetical protein
LVVISYREVVAFGKGEWSGCLSGSVIGTLLSIPPTGSFDHGLIRK